MTTKQTWVAPVLRLKLLLCPTCAATLRAELELRGADAMARIAVQALCEACLGQLPAETARLIRNGQVIGGDS